MIPLDGAVSQGMFISMTIWMMPTEMGGSGKKKRVCIYMGNSFTANHQQILCFL